MPEIKSDYAANAVGGYGVDAVGSGYLKGQQATARQFEQAMKCKATAIDDVNETFRQLHELCEYANTIVEKLCGIGEGCSLVDGQKEASAILPRLSQSATAAQRAIDVAISSLRRLESQIP